MANIRILAVVTLIALVAAILALSDPAFAQISVQPISVRPLPSRGAPGPAITACEAGLKSTLMDGMVYRRINAQLTGATVRIDYETKFKKDAAVPGSLTCKFRFIEASDYFLFQFDEAPQECRDLINRGKVEGSHGKMRDLCNRLVEAVDRVKTIQESAVRGLGVYPISAKSTALSKTP
jgi:hypothetical protein